MMRDVLMPTRQANAVDLSGRGEDLPGRGASRREVLLGLGAAAVSFGLTPLGCARSPARKKGTIIGPGRFVTGDTGKMSFVLLLFDLDAGGSKSVDMTFFGHGLAQHPL